jgi:type I restriction enzyme S subunit
MNPAWPMVPIGDVLRRSEDWISIDPGKVYKEVTVKLWGRGVVLRREVPGAEIQSDRRATVRAGQFILSRIDARNGALGAVPSELDGAVVSNDFPVFTPDPSRLDVKYLGLLSRTQRFVDLCRAASEGTTNRVRLKEDRFLSMQIALPPLPEQRRIVARVEELAGKIERSLELDRQATRQANVLIMSIAKGIREKLLATKLSSNRLGDLAVVTSGGTPARDMPAYWDGTIPWVKTGELLDGDIYDTEERITQEGLSNSSAKVFPPGTVLVALYGQGQTRGRTGRLMIEATTNQACCAILPALSALDSGFVQLWLRSLYSEMREESRNGAQPNWNAQMIKEIEIVVPSLPEQLRYVHFCQALQSKVAAIVKGQTEVAAEIHAMMRSTIEAAFDMNRIKLSPVTSEPRS